MKIKSLWKTRGPLGQGPKALQGSLYGQEEAGQMKAVQASEDLGLASAKGLMHCVALGESLLLSESTFPHEKNGLASSIYDPGSTSFLGLL